ncbi:MAG: hypothetical protein ABH829_03795 [archaeon]
MRLRPINRLDELVAQDFLRSHVFSLWGRTQALGGKAGALMRMTEGIYFGLPISGKQNRLVVDQFWGAYRVFFETYQKMLSEFYKGMPKGKKVKTAADVDYSSKNDQTVYLFKVIDKYEDNGDLPFIGMFAFISKLLLDKGEAAKFQSRPEHERVIMSYLIADLWREWVRLNDESINLDARRMNRLLDVGSQFKPTLRYLQVIDNQVIGRVIRLPVKSQDVVLGEVSKKYAGVSRRLAERAGFGGAKLDIDDQVMFVHYVTGGSIMMKSRAVVNMYNDSGLHTIAAILKLIKESQELAGVNLADCTVDEATKVSDFVMGRLSEVRFTGEISIEGCRSAARLLSGSSNVRRLIASLSKNERILLGSAILTTYEDFSSMLISMINVCANTINAVLALPKKYELKQRLIRTQLAQYTMRYRTGINFVSRIVATVANLPKAITETVTGQTTKKPIDGVITSLLQMEQQGVKFDSGFEPAGEAAPPSEPSTPSKGSAFRAGMPSPA